MKQLLPLILIMAALGAKGQTKQDTAVLHDTAITMSAYIDLLSKFKDSSAFNKLPIPIKNWLTYGGYDMNGIWHWVVPKEWIEISKRR